MSNFDSSAEMGEASPSRGGYSGQPQTYLTLPKAIEFGQYEPLYLSTFVEFTQLDRHSQFELIKEALDNRRRQLIKQWAEVNNVLDYSEKPHLQTALRNIEKQQRKVEKDRERLYIEYSNA
jgi:hypothetical protein